MFPVLLLLFILVPVIEIGLFIQVGGWLGLWPTLALVLITAFVGASLVRSQGIMTLASVQDRLNRGELPAQQILEGVMLAVAGVLLLTPGFMTDAMGMLVLLPGPRAALAKQVMKRVTVSQAGFSQGSFHQGSNAQGPFGEDPFRRGGRGEDGNTFEGEYERKDDDDDHRLR
ncbi:membrane protein FxsA [Salinivibrio sp. IB574]|uniref:FxsA family protein n=1 Tax=Salinivibrio sp. IB574 TaxID=1909444 RepID=UPI0009895A33|nr:FxsA family protein [Salinivibrio sp. IB574]OOF21004.1 membrane protein FxsA [Salinivibrio sp. IB574]